MSNIFVLPMDFQLGEIKLNVHPVVLKDEKELILVDCGYPGFMPKIQDAMEKTGLLINDITKIIITHHDHDHMGALQELKDTYPAIEILCSKADAPYITGERKSLRLQQAEAIQGTLPDSEKEEGLRFQKFISSIQKVAHVTELTPGDVLPQCGGIEIVDTKGHMPGHISLYVQKEKTLIAGDALIVENRKLCMAMPQFVLNTQDAQESVKRLLDYDIEKIICYHGGVYTDDVKKSIIEVVNHFC